MARPLLFCLYCLFALLVPLAASAAPEIPEDRWPLLKGLTSDGNDGLETQPGFYVLLNNAKGWKADDFADEQGDTPPSPDYQAIRDKPADARGQVFYIEGWVAKADRYPSGDRTLNTVTHQGIGEQVTRWTIVTEKDNPEATIIVLLHDPNGRIAKPKQNSKVRVAARFYKLWSTRSSEGKPFTYPVFVGGAAEVVAQPSGGASSPSMMMVTTGLLVLAVGAFFIVRIMIKKQGGSGGETRMRLDEIRREREYYEQLEEQEDEDGEGDEPAEDLPKDPVAALDALSQKHDGKNDQ